MPKTLEELEADINASLDRLIAAQAEMAAAVAENQAANAALAEFTATQQYKMSVPQWVGPKQSAAE